MNVNVGASVPEFLKAAWDRLKEPLGFNQRGGESHMMSEAMAEFVIKHNPKFGAKWKLYSELKGRIGKKG